MFSNLQWFSAFTRFPSTLSSYSHYPVLCSSLCWIDFCPVLSTVPKLPFSSLLCCTVLSSAVFTVLYTVQSVQSRTVLSSALFNVLYSPPSSVKYSIVICTLLSVVHFTVLYCPLQCSISCTLTSDCGLWCSISSCQESLLASCRPTKANHLSADVHKSIPAQSVGANTLHGSQLSLLDLLTESNNKGASSSYLPWLGSKAPGTQVLYLRITNPLSRYTFSETVIMWTISL